MSFTQLFTLTANQFYRMQLALATFYCWNAAMFVSHYYFIFLYVMNRYKFYTNSTKRGLKSKNHNPNPPPPFCQKNISALEKVNNNLLSFLIKKCGYLPIVDSTRFSYFYFVSLPKKLYVNIKYGKYWIANIFAGEQIVYILIQN